VLRYDADGRKRPWEPRPERKSSGATS
jgi:hypothetical protein